MDRSSDENNVVGAKVLFESAFLRKSLGERKFETYGSFTSE